MAGNDIHKQYISEKWDKDSGLPGNNITAIAHNEFLWIGTRAGLARYDGTVFHTFTTGNTPELTSNRILSLHSDNQNRLWIGTDGGGLLSYYRGEWKTYKLTNNHIKAITSDWDGNIWVGTGYGLCKLRDGAVKRYTIDDGLAGNIITALEFDSWGNLWIASLQRGVTKYFDNSFVIYDGGNGLDNLLIKSLFCDKMGNLHVGTIGGIYQLQSTESRFTKLSQTDYVPVTCFLEKDNNLWLGTINDGLKILTQNRIANSDVLSGQYITCLLEDRDGNFWIGTESDGLIHIQWNDDQNISLNTKPEITGRIISVKTSLFFIIAVAVILFSVFVLSKGNFLKFKPSKSPEKPVHTIDPNIIENLDRIIAEDKVYLDPDLTMKKLAQKLKIPNNLLSRLINVRYKKNYNDFINYYRIQEARKLLTDPRERNNTISDIMYRCGFYSKSTFNTAFKKVSGMTPSQYRKKNRPATE